METVRFENLSVRLKSVVVFVYIFFWLFVIAVIKEMIKISGN